MRFRAEEHAVVEAKEIVWDDAAAPEVTFPPTVLKMLAGMQDGKKRALFILTNFLRSVGWGHDMIEERLLAWNKQNDPPLRESEITNHLRYHKQRAQTVLPPNFDNDIYKDLGVLVHDELSARVKNPVQYVRLKLKQRGPSKETKKKGTEKSVAQSTRDIGRA
jgi:DNA primase large subunit